jgi:hypothetical protein
MIKGQTRNVCGRCTLGAHSRAQQGEHHRLLLRLERTTHFPPPLNCRWHAAEGAQYNANPMPEQTEDGTRRCQLTIHHHFHQHWHHALTHCVLLACAVARCKPAEHKHRL